MVGCLKALERFRKKCKDYERTRKLSLYKTVKQSSERSEGKEEFCKDYGRVLMRRGGNVTVVGKW